MPGVLEASHHLGWAEVMCAARTRSGINGKPRVTREFGAVRSALAPALLSGGPCGDSRAAAATPITSCSGVPQRTVLRFSTSAAMSSKEVRRHLREGAVHPGGDHRSGRRRGHLGGTQVVAVASERGTSQQRRLRSRYRQHKLTTRLVAENQRIVIEDLWVRNMVRTHSLARAISDASWSEL